MVKIKIEMNLPDELLQPLLQHLRDFDISHDPQRTGAVHMMMGIEAPDLSAQTIEGIFHSIQPPFESESVLPPTGNA